MWQQRTGARNGMTEFHGYFDTGGTQAPDNGSILITFGVVATAAKWERFDQRWKAVLSQEGVSELHMKHFAHSKKEFAKWKGDETRRAAFLKRLTAEAKRGMNKAFGCAVVLPDYRKLDAQFMLTERLGGPYSIAQSICIAMVTEWLIAKKRGQDKVAYFIEDGDTGQPAFRRFIKSQGYEPIVLPRRNASGEPYTPFQVADFLAYEHRLLYEQFLKAGRPQKVRGAFRQLRRMLAVDVGIFDEPALRAWCEAADFKPRP
jgi:hypothetical protein